MGYIIILYLIPLYLIPLTIPLTHSLINWRSYVHLFHPLIACALAHNYEVTTTYSDLIEFLQQEFSKTIIASLSLINKWLKNQLIEWNEQRQSIIEDWDKCNEARQPLPDIEEFENFTGYEYVGLKY